MNEIQVTTIEGRSINDTQPLASVPGEQEEDEKLLVVAAVSYLVCLLYLLHSVCAWVRHRLSLLTLSTVKHNLVGGGIL